MKAVLAIPLLVQLSAFAHAVFLPSKSYSVVVCAVTTQTNADLQGCSTGTVTRTTLLTDLATLAQAAVNNLNVVLVCPNLAVNVTLPGTGFCRYVTPQTVMDCTGNTMLSSATSLTANQFMCLMARGGRTISIVLRSFTKLSTNAFGRKRRSAKEIAIDNKFEDAFDSECVKKNRDGRTEYIYTLSSSFVKVNKDKSLSRQF